MVTVVVLDAAGADDEGGANSDKCSAASSAGSSGSDSGDSGDSGSYPPRLLDVPVTPAELVARAAGLDGVVLRGWHIRALRRYAGLSVPELAERLAFSRSQVWSWECERHRCPTYVYPALIAVIEAAHAEREALLQRARLYVIVLDDEREDEREDGSHSTRRRGS